MGKRPFIYYSKEFFRKKFTAETMKKAYMDACKWYSSNVISKDELHSVQIEFEKIPGEALPTLMIHLYAVLSEDELRERHCNICRESHSVFYMNNYVDCNKCAAKAYQERTDDMLRVKLEYYHGLILKRAKEDDDNEDN